MSWDFVSAKIDIRHKFTVNLDVWTQSEYRSSSSATKIFFEMKRSFRDTNLGYNFCPENLIGRKGKKSATCTFSGIKLMFFGSYLLKFRHQFLNWQVYTFERSQNETFSSQDLFFRRLDRQKLPNVAYWKNSFRFPNFFASKLWAGLLHPCANRQINTCEKFIIFFTVFGFLSCNKNLIGHNHPKFHM